MDLELIVKTNKFAKIGDDLADLMDLIVRKTAFDIEAHAKANCPVDTGALRASIHTITSHDSGYAKAIADAKSRNPDATYFAAVGPTEKIEAVVAVGIGYGIFVEMGTVHKGAHPFLQPAIEAARPTFTKAIRKVMVYAV